MTLFRWSRTAANNATIDVTAPFPEGMSASALNDSSRGQMAAIAKFRDDVAGAIVSGGTSTAYTVASYQGFDTLANLDGKVIYFSPHTTNGDTVTLNVDSLGAKPLRSAPSVELVAGTLVQGTPYGATYNNSDGVWYLRGFVSSPYNVPFLGGMDFWDTITPNSSFIFPAGQALSRTVYSRAFARWGTTYGAGDGSTTFNVPDKTERVSVMKAATASRLTTAGSGIDGATMGSTGGAQNVTLAQANLPNIVPTFTGTQGTATSTNSNVAVNANASNFGTTIGGGGSVPSLSVVTNLSSTYTPTGTISSINGNVTQTATNKMPPTIVCNYIIRIL